MLHSHLTSSSVHSFAVSSSVSLAQHLSNSAPYCPCLWLSVYRDKSVCIHFGDEEMSNLYGTKRLPCSTDPVSYSPVCPLSIRYSLSFRFSHQTFKAHSCCVALPPSVMSITLRLNTNYDARCKSPSSTCSHTHTHRGSNLTLSSSLQVPLS